MKLKKTKKHSQEKFIKKYEKLAPTYAKSLLQGDNFLKKIKISKETKELIKLNDRLKKNDTFSHDVIDKLLESKNPITLCEISFLAIFINYRKEDAIKIIKCNLKKIDNKVYILLRKTFLRIECNVYIDEKEAEDN